ncbi:paraquat-inducible protein A [Seohaeicola saemankumensis]|nr:paraquat-inducible protein A [Seohaeicola saemankumensis]
MHDTSGAAGRLIACPVCDVLHRETPVPVGQKARCRRCGTVLYAPRESAMTQIVMLAVTAAILMVAAIFFPFLELDAGGLNSRSSVFDAVLAFASGPLLPLSLAVAALIVVLPLVRLAAVTYALAPMVFGFAPAAHAEPAMRLAERTRPWAMAEIFIVGVAVALVKVAGLAHVTLGPAFWAFLALVLITVLNDNLMCRLTIWKTLEDRRNS